MARNPHQLTREQMEKIIAEGGSVLHDGRIINQVAQLPSKADLAKGDPEKENAAKSELQAQLDDLKAQLAKLEGEKNAPPEKPKPDTGEKPKGDEGK